MIRRALVVLGVCGATLFAAFSIARAQPPIDPPTDEPTSPPPTTAPPTESPDPDPCIPGLNCPRATRSPTPKPTRSPTPTRPPSAAPTLTPTPASTGVARTEEPTPTVEITPSPTPSPVAASPNRGLAVVGLFGSGGMIGSAAWIWRRYLG